MHRQTLSCQNASTLGRAARLNRPRTAVSTRHLVSRRGLHVIAFDEGSMKGGAEEKGTNTRTVPITLSVPLKVSGSEDLTGLSDLITLSYCIITTLSIWKKHSSY